MNGYEKYNVYYGDLHNHCAVGYGHGTLEDAFTNARMQLDFASVTVHGYWPDMPTENGRLADAVEYHKKGFARTREAWPRVQQIVDGAHEPDRFVTFLAYEWHSLKYGDHNVYFKHPDGDIIRADTLEEMRDQLRKLAENGIECFIIPHHIGYKQGYRGINWNTFGPEFSPIVEIFSMHGASESGEAPYPYLHTMGPRDFHSTFQYGLAQGHIAGAVGSTDHHSAHPGSYGHGLAGIWSESLTRDGIWEAIRARRTYALTGDRIHLTFAINGRPMGTVLPATQERYIEVDIIGGGALDYIEVLHNNHVLNRWNGTTLPTTALYTKPRVQKVYLELGWGKKRQNVDWNVALRVEDGQLLDVEPRFRGHEILAPSTEEETAYAFSSWERTGEAGVQFLTRTWGNPTTSTTSTQGVCLTIRGTPKTTLRGMINDRQIAVPLRTIREGPLTGYLGGLLTPAYCFHRAVDQREYSASGTISHHTSSDDRDWYYVRVRQKNGQWAWSSPIWVG